MAQNLIVDNDWGTGSSAEYVKNDGGSSNPSPLSLSDDRVGIGTTSPQKNLHLRGTGDIKASIESTNYHAALNLKNDQHTWNLQVRDETGNLQVIQDESPWKAFLEFSNQDGPIVRNGAFSESGHDAKLSLGDPNHYIKSEYGVGVKIGSYDADPAVTVRQQTGNVGIGTTDPRAELDCSGQIRALSHTPSWPFPGGGKGVELVYSSGDDDGRVISCERDASGDPTFQKLRIQGSPVIFDEGKVGIGTGSPDSTLDVDGQIKLRGGSPGAGKVLTSDANGVASWQTPSGMGDFSDGGEAGGSDRTLGNTDNYDLGFLTDNQVRLQIQKDGKVGIGTTEPGQLLEIETSDYYGGIQLTNTGTNGVSWGIHSVNSNETGFLDGSLGIRDGSDWRVVVKDGGNVGIGTANPEAKLDVNGGIKAGGQTIVDSDGFLMPRHSSNSNAKANSIYINSSTGELTFKDSGGTPHALY